MKKLLSLILCLVLLFSLAACSAGTGKGKTQTLTDQAGREVAIPQNPETLVSGYYISTSVLIALGVQSKLVGVEAKADKRPIYALAAPELINLPNTGSAKDFNLEGCAALNPQIVILPKKLKEQAENLEKLGFATLLVDPEDDKSLEEMITLLAKATGKEEAGTKLITRRNEIKQTISDKLGGCETVSVYLAGNSSYLSTAGGKMYQSALIEAAGGRNVAENLEDTYWAEVSYEQLLAWNPEAIILAADAEYSIDDVLSDPTLAEIAAVKNGCVYQIPGDIEAWDSPVPGSVLGSAYAAAVLHPDCISMSEVLTMIQDFYKDFYGFTYEP